MNAKNNAHNTHTHKDTSDTPQNIRINIASVVCFLFNIQNNFLCVRAFVLVIFVMPTDEPHDRPTALFSCRTVIIIISFVAYIITTTLPIQ